MSAAEVGVSDILGVDELDAVLTRGRFSRRHLGSHHRGVAEMLREVGCSSLEELISKTVPEEIRSHRSLDLPPAATEEEALAELREIASMNEIRPTYIGMGYHGTYLPAVIRRNILEIQAGTLPILPIRRRSRRVVWRHW